MKIGILTFHRALNYGALLQTYALQKVISGFDVKSEIIDYRNPIIEEAYRNKGFWERKGAIDKLRYILHRKNEVDKREKFKAFIKNQLCLTKESYLNNDDLKKINDCYDVYITGSDQVWYYGAHDCFYYSRIYCKC